MSFFPNHKLVQKIPKTTAEPVAELVKIYYYSMEMDLTSWTFNSNEDHLLIFQEKPIIERIHIFQIHTLCAL